MSEITGTSSSENLIGTSQDDRIFGNGGNDQISAGLGNDWIEASGTLSGGPGNDTYIARPIGGLFPSRTRISDTEGRSIIVGDALLEAHLGDANDYVVIEGGTLGDPNNPDPLGRGNDEIHILGIGSRFGAAVSFSLGPAPYVTDGDADVVHIYKSATGSINIFGIEPNDKIIFHGFPELDSPKNIASLAGKGVLTSLELPSGLSLSFFTSGDDLTASNFALSDREQAWKPALHDNDFYWSYTGSPLKENWTLSGELYFLGGGDDEAFGSDASEVVYAEGGDDMVVAGGGGDELFGGSGADILRGGAGSDEIFGGGGRDRLGGGTGDDLLDGGADNDALFGGPQNDRVLGGDGDDFVYGDSGRDSLGGGNGEDLLTGDWGRDWLWGGPGDDSLRGNGGNDTLRGEDGTDKLAGGRGLDLFIVSAADTGTDWIFGFNDREKVRFDGFGLTKWGLAWRAETNGNRTEIDADDDGTAEVVLLGFTDFGADNIA